MPVYLIQAGETGPVKIGVAKRPEARLRELQTGNGERLCILRMFDGGRAEEASLHAAFAEQRLYGEWFSFASEMLTQNFGLNPIESLPIETDSLERRMRRGDDRLFSPDLCRGARALIQWSQSDLAQAAKVAKKTIADFELEKRNPYSGTLDILQTTLEKAGVVFVEEEPEDEGAGPGVRLKQVAGRKPKSAKEARNNA